jgi:hypothetical protein
MKKVALGLGITMCVVILVAGGCVASLVGWFAKDAINVAKKEFSPTRLLQKYEWFKDQAAALDSMRSKIAVFEENVKSFVDNYGEDRKDWPRDVRQDYAMSRAETVAVKSQFNNLAADYNAQMAKFNYAFCNAGQMPAGLPANLEPLPRKFATYLTR